MAKLSQLNEKAAAFDIGSEKVFLALPDSSVMSFQTFTTDFELAVKVLLENQITTVAMESTGVYGCVLYDMIERSGIKVYLVNPSNVKMLPGRKSDVQDCQWLQELHSYGLLHGSFIPEQSIRVFRSYVRLRETHIAEKSRCINRMQKALTLMNIRLHQVISQIHGVSGMRVIKAILAGERDGKKLLSLCHSTIVKNKSEEVIKSLVGNYQEEHLFALQQSVNAYEFYETLILECDKKIDQELISMNRDKAPANEVKKTKPIRHHKPAITSFHEKMVTFVGKDITSLPGISSYNLMQITSEVGTNLSRFPGEQNFTSWLGLSPGKNTSGKYIKRARAKGSPRAGQIFREAAQTLLQSKNIALGDFARRVRARRGSHVAIKATARKLAELYYRAITKGLDYVEQGIEQYQKKMEENQIKSLIKRAKALNLILVPA